MGTITIKDGNLSAAMSTILIEWPHFIHRRSRSTTSLWIQPPLRRNSRLISQGLSNKHIARALEISPETVKSHVKSIFLKLAVRARSEAVFRAVSLGLL